LPVGIARSDEEEHVPTISPQHPVVILEHCGLGEPLHDLTFRTTGGSRPVVVFRAGDTDVLRANARPFYVLGVWAKPDGTYEYTKVSWHRDRAAALESYRRKRDELHRGSSSGEEPTRGFAVVTAHANQQ
jgi:hypothetical protein